MGFASERSNALPPSLQKRDFAIERSFPPQKGHIAGQNSKRNFIRRIAAFKFTLQIP